MHWETKKFVTSFTVILYCDGLEPNPQYLRGTPVITIYCDMSPKVMVQQNVTKKAPRPGLRTKREEKRESR